MMRGPVGRDGGLIDVGHEVRDTKLRLWDVIAVDRERDTATLSRPGSGTVVINRHTGQRVDR